jgi:flagellar basal body-associated protein FliL
LSNCPTLGRKPAVFVIIVVMIVILLLAGLVVAYVAYPHRGEDLPAAPWLGDAMNRAADAAPLIETEYDDSDPSH